MNTVKRCLTIILIFLFLRSIPPMIDDVEAVPSRGYLDVAVADIQWSSSWGSRVWPGEQIEIIISIGHDPSPTPSSYPIIPEDNLTLLIITDDGYDNVTSRYYPIPNLGLNYTLESGLNYNPYYFKFMMWANISNGFTPVNIEGEISVTANLLISDNDTSDNGLSKSIIVQDIQSQPFIWEEGQKDKAYESPVPHWVEVGQIVMIPFELQNRGSEADTFRFDLLEVPTGWNVSIGGDTHVYSEDHEDIELFVQVSQNPHLAMHDEVIRVIVRARSIYQPNMTYLDSPHHIFEFKVRFKAGAELLPEMDTVTLVPGEDHNVIFWLNNTGNGQDDYVLDIQIDEIHLQKGWRVAFQSGTRLPTVDPAELFMVILRVTIPSEASLYYNVILELELVSMNSDLSITSDPCLLMVGEKLAADIEDINEPFPVEPGEYNKINFNFTNEGNTPGKTLNLTVMYKPKGWMVEIDIVPIQGSILQSPIGPLTTKRLAIHVFVLETTVASSKGSMPFIVIRATGGEYNVTLDEERFYFKIPIRHKALVWADIYEIYGSPGDEVRFNLTVENRGNWLDTFDMSLDGVEFETEIDMSDQEIAPGEVYSLKATFTIPLGWPADAYSETIWPLNGSYFDPYQLFLQARSQNETTPDISLSEHEIRVYIEPVYDVEMDVVDGPIWSIPFEYDQSRTFLVEVVNKGNCIVKMNISLEQGPDWVEVISEQVELPYNGTRYVPVFLRYNAFDMEAYTTSDLVLDIDVMRLDGSFMEVDQILKFSFPPYLYNIKSVDNDKIQKDPDGYYPVMSGVNLTFDVTIQREGRTVYLPDDISSPYIVCRINGIEKYRSKIDPMTVGDTGVYYIDLLPISTLGWITINFTIEGMGLESEDGYSEISLRLFVEKEESEDDTDGKGLAILLIVIFVMVLLALIVGVGMVIARVVNRDIGTENNNKKELLWVPGPPVGSEHHEGDTAEE